MKRFIINLLFAAGVGFIFVSCDNDDIGPVINLQAENFVSAEIINPTTADPMVFDPANADDVAETFRWTLSSYGANIPLNYIVELSLVDDFSVIGEVNVGNNNSWSPTVQEANDRILELGAQAFSEATVFIRVRTEVVGAEIPDLFSNALERDVTTFRLSDCGQFCTVGIIGSATNSPAAGIGGWDTDTNMRLADPSGSDRSTWTITLFLNSGEVKFREGDAWDTNWGASSFPTGTGELNGPNIPIATAGWYKVTFNDQTTEYSFEALNPSTFASMGIIGDATPGGWDNDTDMTETSPGSHIWKLASIALTDGEVKFRANDAWDDNWGGTATGTVTSPSGIGDKNGPNIPATAGTFSIYFNDVTGEYALQTDGTEYATIGIIGPATAGGWDSDTDLVRDPYNPYKWSVVLTLSEGEAKFRADDAWDNNWGAVGFPSAVSLKNGPNIEVPSGKYVITIDTGTGEYRFLK